MITRYIGPFQNVSGYAQAARSNVLAMVRAGIDVTLQPVSFEDQYTSHGEIGKIIQAYTNCKGYWDMNIIHLTPENWPKFIQRDKYNIGYTVWETDRLPASWVPIINSVQEVWVPSKFNVIVFRNSGITIPIKVVPHCFDTNIKQIDTDKFDYLKDIYKFFSIFQWTPRKNPEGLLEAYLTEFSSDEKVCLLLKTYHMGWSDKQQSIIKNSVREIKNKIGHSSYPQIQFIGNLLSGDDIDLLYQIGDCCVMPHRGEGFGLVPATAMLHGKITISSNWGGNLEYMDHTNSCLVDGKIVPVTGMPWTIYTDQQNWFEPNISRLKEVMRFCFENQESTRLTAEIGQDDVRERLSLEKIGQTIKELLLNAKI